MDKIKVISQTVKADAENNIRIVCSMSDGSMYECDRDGTNWYQLSLSDEELTKKFNER